MRPVGFQIRQIFSSRDFGGRHGDIYTIAKATGFRRTCVTRMADLGIQPHIIEAMLNHVLGHKAGVAGVYNRSAYTREVKNALVIWADHVRQITTGVAPTVVPLRGVVS